MINCDRPNCSNANQRTKRTDADGTFWDYGYDSLGQVTSAVRYWAAEGTNAPVPVAGQQYGFLFDDIGNRKTATLNSNVSEYAANLLNQYTQRTVPGLVDIIGAAASNATVTVNQVVAGRKGDYFRHELALANTNAAAYTPVSILASMTYNGTNVVVTNTGSAFLPKTPEIFNHDSDGSLTNDGRWAYTWDAENRLIGMETDTNKVGAAGVPHQKLIFQYDAQSRRISKVVSNFNGSTWSEVSNLRFIWDGWNLLAELDKTNAVVRSYAWGLDLSGTEQGAGGIGGLLWVNLPQASNTQARGSHFVAFDGNGNVAALLNAQTAQTSAEYEYGPFGETIRATGPAVSVNPFQFSTKYRDAETGLLYYGYRYYRPGTGSWLSQDPLEEIGSRNLYQYVANNPIVLTDYLGMLELQVWQRIKNGLISGGSGAATGAGTGALVGAGVGAIGGLGAGAAPGAGAGAILGGIGGGIGGFINGVLRDPNTTTGVLVTQGAIGGVVGGITGGVGGGLSGTTGLLVPSLSSGIAGTSAGGAASATLGTTLSTTTLSTVNSVGITTAAATIASSAGGNGKCCFQWVGARGPDPQGYGARLDGGVNRNLKVTTPENFSRHFDAAQPGYPSTSPTLLIEAKTGHQWAADPNAPSNWLATRAIQFSMQAYIASRCGCQYKIYVNNPVGAQGLKQHLPMFPVEYYP